MSKRKQSEITKLQTPEDTITSFTDPRLKWSKGEPGEGNAGMWRIAKQHPGGGESLIINPAPGLDYWARTFYDPLLVKHDAQTLLAEVPAEKDATLEVAFSLTPKGQFDQAGIMVHVDDSTWVKAGIEYTDGIPRLSCVVTNDGYSDWSTQVWPDWKVMEHAGPSAGGEQTSARVRVSKLVPPSEQGPTLVMEAAMYDPSKPEEEPQDWKQVRIASLRSGAKPWLMGFFSISPIPQEPPNGSAATFSFIKLGPKVDPVHHTDAGHT